MSYSIISSSLVTTRTSLIATALLSLVACSGSGSAPATLADDVVTVASDGEISDDEQNLPQVIVRTSEDISVMSGETFDVSAAIILETTLANLPIYQWQVLNPEADVIIDKPDSTRTTMLFNTAGLFEVQFTASIGEQYGEDSIMVTVEDPIINRAPQVNAGNSINLDFNQLLELNGVADDDGLPASSISTQWTFSSNDGNATFGESSQTDTSVTFDFPGTYTLSLTAFDGELSSTDSLIVTVNEPKFVEPEPDTSVTAGGVNANRNWKSVTTSNGSKPQARHEAGAVMLNGDMYLLAGRAKRRVNRYDLDQNKWTTEGNELTDFSHFQPVAYQGKIYAVGGLTCCFPREELNTHIQIFNPTTKKWSQGGIIPANRRRGGAGAVLYKDKIYLIGGNTKGHDGGAVGWFDEYNPATNTWKTLKTAPNKRDHINVVVVGDRLIVAAGRRTDHPNTFNDVVRETDVYNFKTGKWETNHPDIPTPTAGAMVVAVANEAIVIGGEIGSSGAALSKVQAYNVVSKKWRTLKPLLDGRHSGGAAVLGKAIHVVSGNTTRGGGNETQSHEKLELD
jgi:hypothetical protein